MPGAIKDASTADESFAAGVLDGKHYTRPENWRGMTVPQVLLSGHHAQIAQWRRQEALALTARQRPDLIERARAAGQLSALDEGQLRDRCGCTHESVVRSARMSKKRAVRCNQPSSDARKKLNTRSTMDSGE